jgi:serine/threonine protein kinase
MFTRSPHAEPPPLARAKIGKVLRGKWRLDALLGAGGMATVYAATHRNGKRGAVKILHAELAVDHNARARFLQEGYAANKVGHAGAVSVLDDDEEVVRDRGGYLLRPGEYLPSRRGRLAP